MNQISPFEYVSILVSIILGLGIAQLLSALADLLYHFKHIKWYWPHLIWVVFILFLHIQDWFITYQLKYIAEWTVPKLGFVLLYPIMLFLSAKMLLPTNTNEETTDMKQFYYSQFRIIFVLMAVCILLSVFFNVYLLNRSWNEQLILFVFFGNVVLMAITNTPSDRWHKGLALAIFIGAIVASIAENDFWAIK